MSVRAAIAKLGNGIRRGRTNSRGVRSMGASEAAALKTIDGDSVPLQGLNVDADIRDLLSEVAVTQTYRNEETVNIEAVYTFPLPQDAVLLELTVTIGERVLSGTVIERKEAEEHYEDAITDGDTAIMLQQVEPGMYTMNVGNLQAGETVVIRFRYAMLQCWSGDHLRFMLPTTIAPRYGDPGLSGLAPHQQPEYDSLGEMGYSMRVRVSGLLSGGEIESPSHAISVARGSDETVIQLAQGAEPLDRDFVLNFRLSDTVPACLTIDRDIEGYVALASFKPAFEEAHDESPRSLKVVVDCSGSMGGDSIAQAREALLRILDALRPQDYFNIVAFGSHYATLFDRQVSVSHKNIDQARRFVRCMDADMGGTEIGAALQVAYGLAVEVDMYHDVLLITDGEVWNTDRVLRDAREARHRVFTVGVGTSVAEYFVRQLAESTAGACELVSPNENMAERIYRHFQRMCSPRARNVSIEWPVMPEATYPEVPGPVYEGDTVHSFAWFKEPPEGDASMVITLPNGHRMTQSARPRFDTVTNANAQESSPAIAGTLGRIAASKKLRSLDDAEEGVELALRYQLMSELTNYLVIDKREEESKADDLPSLRKVPQMLSAGWGGTGSVVHKCRSMKMAPGIKACSQSDFDRPTVLRRKMAKSKSSAGDMDYLDIPAFLRREGGGGNKATTIDKKAFVKESGPRRSDSYEDDVANIDKKVSLKEIGPQGFIKGLNRCSTDWFVPSLRIDRLVLLSGTGLQDDVLAVLRAIAESGNRERIVVTVFLYLLAVSEDGAEMSRESRRAIRKAYKDIGQNEVLIGEILKELAGIPLWGDLG